MDSERNIHEIEYKGMTVNERLYVKGLTKDFDKATAEGDKQEVIEIFKKGGFERRIYKTNIGAIKFKMKVNPSPNQRGIFFIPDLRP